MAARKQPKLLEARSRAPEFRLPLLDGGITTLPEILVPGPALIAFFKVTCPICQLTLPYLERIHAAGTLRIYSVSQNAACDTRDFNQDFHLTFPTLLDSEDDGFPASNAFGISTVPTLFLVEPEGVISRVIEGWQKKEMAALGLLFRQGDNVPEWKAG
jgi:peroxiredoxin